MENSDYSKKDILIALRNAGLVKGDDILVHSNLGFFGKLDGNNYQGRPEECAHPEQV